MSNRTEYLKQRLQIYDAMLKRWRGLPGLEQDYADLGRHRDNVHDWFKSAVMKRGPQKRVRTEKELKAFGGLFKKRSARVAS
jgi:hypothetical protein